MTKLSTLKNEVLAPEVPGLYDGLNANELRRLMDHALQSGTTESLMQLFDDGISIDQEDHEGRTPLMMCIAQGKVEAVEVLLARDADINRVFMYHGRIPNTALDAARQTGRTALVETLLARGAKTGREIMIEQQTVDV